MNTSPYEAFAEAAADGIDFDDIRATRSDDHIEVTTPETTVTASASTPRSGLSEVEPYVTDWHFWHQYAPQAEDRYAFLRWIESADERSVPERYGALTDGHRRSWGQLSITVTLGENGRRLYDLRHEDDADMPREELTPCEDPREMRDIVRADADGRYRPLKTAPTIDSGWVYHDVAAGTLLEAIEYCYPATVANWHREREGKLDISHWRETMERQTGIYGIIQTWDRGEGHDHVEWVAEACCEDSQCLKRREWQYDEATPLSADGGDGEFPCREPCSLVVSAARQWTKLEGEQTQTYEFDLTPSEKDQLESIIDAVAEGRADEIREADIYEGANRYRTRFLRAKLFDDEGTLPTSPEE